MTVDIEEKQMPENTADDINFKKDIRQLADDFEVKIGKLDPDDKYALKCQICAKDMILQHNIHTNALLIQSYECKCVYNDNHIIVRDNRTNESVVHRSKGMTHDGATYGRCDLLQAIVYASYRYWRICSLTYVDIADERPDLIVDKHLIAEYDIKHGSVKDDVNRLDNSESTSSHRFSLWQPADSGDITYVKHGIRYLAAQAEYCAFRTWFHRLERDTYASITRATISYMNDIYVHEISDGDLEDYRRLIDMIECMSAIFDDLCDRVVGMTYDVSDSVIAEARVLIAAMHEDYGMTYDRCCVTVEHIADVCLVNAGVYRDSMKTLLATMTSMADECTFESSSMEFKLQCLIIEVLDGMTRRLARSKQMAYDALQIEQSRPAIEEFTDKLKIQIANRPSTALNTMHN